MQYRYRLTNSVTGVASGQGIDVSDFQGNFGWGSAKRAIPDLAFGAYRLTQGLGGSGTASPDPFASYNHDAIRDNGLYRMAYHFFDPRLDGAAQARYFVDEHAAEGFTTSDVMWLDHEATGLVSPGLAAERAVSFMDELRSLLPANPIGVYTFIDYALEGNCAGLGNWPLWLAFPSSSAPQAPAPWSHWTFWQWGTRPAASNPAVDADAFNGTPADLANWVASFRSINPVQGLHIVKRGFTGFNIAWNAMPGATSYTAHAKDSHGNAVRTVVTSATSCRLGFLRPGNTYLLTVRAHPGNSLGMDAVLTAKTK